MVPSLSAYDTLGRWYDFVKVAEVEDYTSANTHHLTDEELKAILVKLDYIQQGIGK